MTSAVMTWFERVEYEAPPRRRVRRRSRRSGVRAWHAAFMLGVLVWLVFP